MDAARAAESAYSGDWVMGLLRQAVWEKVGYFSDEVWET